MGQRRTSKDNRTKIRLPRRINPRTAGFEEQVEIGYVAPDGRDHTVAWEEAKRQVKEQQRKGLF